MNTESKYYAQNTMGINFETEFCIGCPKSNPTPESNNNDLIIYTTLRETQFIWQCFEYGIIDHRIINKHDNINDPNIFAQKYNIMNARIQQLNETLLNIRINDSIITLIKSHTKNEHPILPHDNIINQSIRQFFHTSITPSHNPSIKTIINLQPKFSQPTNLYHNNKAILILDNIILPHEISIAIALGPKFIFGAEISDDQLQLMQEAFKQSVSRAGHQAQYIHPLLKSCLRQLTYDHPTRLLHEDSHTIYTKAYLRRCIFMTKIYLLSHPNITIAESDKGKITVVMLRATYIKKLTQHITDGIKDATYINIPDNQNTRSSIDESLTTIYNTVKITYNKWLHTTKKSHNMQQSKALPTKMGQYIPIIKGSIKTHKETKPIRPVISDPNNSLNNLQQTLITILKMFIKDEYKEFIISSSDQLMKQLTQINNSNNGRILPDDHQLATMDFVSMYTNINLKQLFTIINRDFHSTIPKNFHLKQEYLIQWIEACTINFTYVATPVPNYTLIKQNNGIPMGGSLSYFISEIVTADAIFKLINKLPPNSISIIHKYVDDTIIGINPANIDLMTTTFKEILPSMPITIENNTNGSINYLDLTITQKGRTLLYTWYTKKYASQRIINYFSNHPNNMKKNVYLNIIKKALSSTTHNELHTIQMLHSAFKNNSYPPLTYYIWIIDTAKTTTPHKHAIKWLNTVHQHIMHNKFTKSTVIITRINKEISKLKRNQNSNPVNTISKIELKLSKTIDKIFHETLSSMKEMIDHRIQQHITKKQVLQNNTETTMNTPYPYLNPQTHNINHTEYPLMHQDKWPVNFYSKMITPNNQSTTTFKSYIAAPYIETITPNINTTMKNIKTPLIFSTGMHYSPHLSTNIPLGKGEKW